MASRSILSNFFEEQWTQNHQQYLSGLARALFSTTFLEIAVYSRLIPRVSLTGHLGKMETWSWFLLFFIPFIRNSLYQTDIIFTRTSSAGPRENWLYNERYSSPQYLLFITVYYKNNLDFTNPRYSKYDKKEADNI